MVKGPPTREARHPRSTRGSIQVRPPGPHPFRGRRLDGRVEPGHDEQGSGEGAKRKKDTKTAKTTKGLGNPDPLAVLARLAVIFPVFVVLVVLVLNFLPATNALYVRF
jgi:hypothetical protein